MSRNPSSWVLLGGLEQGAATEPRSLGAGCPRGVWGRLGCGTGAVAGAGSLDGLTTHKEAVLRVCPVGTAQKRAVTGGNGPRLFFSQRLCSTCRCTSVRARASCVLTPVFKFCPHRFSSGSLRKKYMLRTKCSSRAVFKNCDAPLLPFFSLWIRICLLLWPLTPLCVCSLSVFCELCVVCLSRLYCVYTCHVRVCLVAHVVFVSCRSCVPVMCTCG